MSSARTATRSSHCGPRPTTRSEPYAAAGADPATKVHSAAEALAPLEGRRLDAEVLRVVRSGIDAMLHAPGTGAPEAPTAQPATELKAVAPRSPVAERPGDATIADVAAQPATRSWPAWSRA
jgi:hypothetical protein